jgi:Pyridoxamine-phosphate oxidase
MAIAPLEVEFWQGRPNRMHDRLLYEKSSEGWILSRLQP